jgi:hypothetical protein
MLIKIWRHNRMKQQDKKWLITMIALIAWIFLGKSSFGMKVLTCELELFQNGPIPFQMPPKNGKPKPEVPKYFYAFASLLLRDLWKTFSGKITIFGISKTMTKRD